MNMNQGRQMTQKTPLTDEYGEPVSVWIVVPLMLAILGAASYLAFWS